LGAVEPAPAPQGPSYDNALPSIRALLPSLFFGAVVPLTVFNLVRHHVHSEAQALIIAGIFPVAWVIFNLIRSRHVDVVGIVVIIGFAVGVITSTLLGGNTYVLKARDSAFTALFGLFCIGSVLTRHRPTIFFVGRYMAAANDPVKKAEYDELLKVPTGLQTFRLLTLVWGAGLLIEASVRLVLADSSILSTSVFLAVSPVISIVCIGGLFAFTIFYTKKAQARGAALIAAAAAAVEAEVPLQA
jgi:hypothetical protein